MLVYIAIFSCISAFLFGYDLGLIGGALPLIKDDLGLTNGQGELIVGGAKLGAVVGTLLGAASMLQFGRRFTIIMDAWNFVLGPIVMAVSPNAAGLLIGRLLIGVSIGCSAVVVPAYLAEVAPAKVRGRVVGLYEVMLCVGMLLAALMDALLGYITSGSSWRWQVAIPVFPALVMICTMWWIPESPRWLVMRDRLEEALQVIHKVHTANVLPGGVHQSTDEVEQELLDLWSSVQKEQRSQYEDNDNVNSEAQQQVEMSTAAIDDEVPLLPNGVLEQRSVQVVNANQDDRTGKENVSNKMIELKNACIGFVKSLGTVIVGIWIVSQGKEKRAFWIVLTLAVFNQAFASTAILNYGPTLLTDADRAGRRPLLLVGSAGSMLSLVLLGVADLISSILFIVICMSVFIFFFSASWAGIFWVILSESFSMEYKSSASFAATAALFLAGSLADLSFLTIRDWLGFVSFFLYAGIAALSGIFVAYFVPETKGSSLAEAQALFSG
eukprot:jgi/Picsp_1/960/NSC_04444-R1_sugar inositol transporter